MLNLFTAIQAYATILHSRMESDKGATAVEYGLLVALIAAVIVTIVATLGGQIAAGFQSVSDSLTDAGIVPA